MSKAVSKNACGAALDATAAAWKRRFETFCELRCIRKKELPPAGWVRSLRLSFPRAGQISRLKNYTSRLSLLSLRNDHPRYQRSLRTDAAQTGGEGNCVA